MLERVWRKGNHPITIGGKVNWVSQYGEQYGGSLKIKLPYDPAVPLLGI